MLDEPTDGIDPKGRAEVRAIVQEERRRGATVFLNSHLLSETERICDQVGILVQGRVLRQGGLLELCGTPDCWTARFAPGFDAQALTQHGFLTTERPDVMRCEGCNEHELNARLAQARNAGALLIELSRGVRDLEAVLLELMEHGDA